MTVQIGPIPSYPASVGPKAAAQLNEARKRYRARIEDIQAELIKTEEAFAEGFARADVAQSARDRITALVKSNRPKNLR